MKPYSKIALLALVAVLIFLPNRSASASSGALEGKIIFGQSFTLESGETLVGDLAVFGGSVTIKQDATVEGDIAVIGGSLFLDGEVKGDVAVVGGAVTLGESAHVTGSLVMVGASLTRAEGAKVDGNIVNNVENWISNVPEVPNIPSLPKVVMPRIYQVANPFQGVSSAFGQSVFLGMLAMLLMLFLVPQTERVARAVMSQPLVAGGLGLLTVILAPIAAALVTVIMVMTILLIPLAPVFLFLFVVLLIVAGVFGWIALGYEIGQRITKAFKWSWHPSLSAGLGTFLLTITANALSGIPVLNCVGWLVPFVLTLAALGAVIMTRFGTRLVLASGSSLPASPASPSSPPDEVLPKPS